MRSALWFVFCRGSLSPKHASKPKEYSPRKAPIGRRAGAAHGQLMSTLDPQPDTTLPQRRAEPRSFPADSQKHAGSGL
ncbi:hypothetical protein AAFF_G00391900 [Aldrovandia affinis]|uniref:Uncharacterized protein n=1 Tax=Aldrovandia affinis TaxID=143900 RepID=A0AAD7SG56_9TELE|nr:hypothetical protein AAFF_G00391900 [Aldrovandia affinis]